MMTSRIQQCCSYAAFALLIFQFHSFAAAVITTPPVSQIIAQGSTASFSCAVDNGLGFWMINGTWVLPTVNFSAYGFTIAIDQDDTGASLSLIAEGRASNNNTRITCVSVDSGDASVSSVEARLVVAGPPAAPWVSFNFLNATAISFSWEKPFSVASVTDILYYTVRMYSRGSVSQDRKEWTVPQTSDTSYAHVVTSDAVATSCDQLVFEVSATSVAGTSPTQSVSGGFPIVPTEMSNDQPEVNIRPTTNALMTAEVIFQLPRVCSYQTANYTLYVRQLSIGNLAQSRQIELTPVGNQAAISAVVVGLASNLNTLFTVLVQTATGKIQFSKTVLKQNLPVLTLALPTVVKGSTVTVYPKPSIAVDSIYCRVLNFPFQNCSSGQFTFNGLPDGEVVIQVIAKLASQEVSNNVTLWVNQNINFCAPYLNENMVTRNGGEVDVEFASSGRPSTYSCSIDSSSFIPCSSPFTIKNLPPGNHVLQVLPRPCPSYRVLSVPFTV